MAERGRIVHMGGSTSRYARCGSLSPQQTTDQDALTCERCRKLAGLPTRSSAYDRQRALGVIRAYVDEERRAGTPFNDLNAAAVEAFILHVTRHPLPSWDEVRAEHSEGK